jgi:hypothetical protein
MATNLRLPGLPETEAPLAVTRHIRGRIAARSLRADVQCPRAGDLEAEAVAAMAAELHGVAGLLSGPRSEENWRARLRGERAMGLADLCRLATDPSREARRAV